jgi:hypothetical protein
MDRWLEAGCEVDGKTTKEPARRRRYGMAALPGTGCELLGGTCWSDGKKSPTCSRRGY